MSKKILIDLGNVRIKEYNNLNHEIEVYEDVYIPTTKTTEKRWRFNGYCTTILKGLRHIQRNELLLDKSQITDLKSYLEQIEKSNAKLLEVMQQ